MQIRRIHIFVYYINNYDCDLFERNDERGAGGEDRLYKFYNSAVESCRYLPHRSERKKFDR